MDVFNSDAFKLRRMTDAINKRPFIPSRLGAMGLFRASGIDTVAAQIEMKEGVLYLVPAAPRGGPAIQNRAEGRKMYPLNTVHLPVEDRLMADEVQSVRSFGTEDQLESVQTKVEEKLTTMRQALEVTHEWHRIGAIKGIQYDSDGTTVLNNFFTIFSITEQDVVHFNFADISVDTSSANHFSKGAIRRLCALIQRRIEDALGATPYEHIHAMVGSDFMDQLVDNAETRDAYHRWQESQALRESWVRRTFVYAGIFFEEYRGNVGERQFISSSEARFFPVGAPDVFRTLFAPANYIETVNTMGLPVYAKTTVDTKGRWVDIDAQSNPLHLCMRPKVLIRGLTAS